MLARLRSRLDPIAVAEAGAAPAAARSDFDLNGGPPSFRPAARPASVLAPLVARQGELWVILTRRADTLARHAGQIAFPGGRLEPGDRTPWAAALREAEEEIGLAPSQVELLGGFDAYETVTGYRIAPYVGVVDPRFAAQPDPREVADVFEAPLAYVLDPARLERHWRAWNGARRHFYAIRYGAHYIWGATAGMLKALSDRLNG